MISAAVHFSSFSYVPESYSQNSFGSTIEILVDRETGINYIWRRSCNAGGLTPLLGTDGQPVVSEKGEYDEK